MFIQNRVNLTSCKSMKGKQCQHSRGNPCQHSRFVTSSNRTLFIERLLVYLIYRLVHYPCKRIHWTQTHMSKKSRMKTQVFNTIRRVKWPLLLRTWAKKIVYLRIRKYNGWGLEGVKLTISLPHLKKKQTIILVPLNIIVQITLLGSKWLPKQNRYR